MDLWRISNYADLQGIGGLRAPGRWHVQGQPVVYLAEHPALCLLETLVHFEIASLDALPESYKLLRVEIPDDCTRAELPLEALPDEWQESRIWTQEAGTEWLATGEQLLLKVPSAILPHSFNYLFNPTHADAARVTIAEVRNVPYDPRILAMLTGSP